MKISNILIKNLSNPKFHGGIGNFYVPETAYAGRHPIIGEQAGFQDTLWGFGMRLVISSGQLGFLSTCKGKNKKWFERCPTGQFGFDKMALDSLSAVIESKDEKNLLKEWQDNRKNISIGKET